MLKKKKCKTDNVMDKCQKTCDFCGNLDLNQIWGCKVKPPREPCELIDGKCPSFCCENFNFEHSCYKSQVFSQMSALIATTLKKAQEDELSLMKYDIEEGVKAEMENLATKA